MLEMLVINEGSAGFRTLNMNRNRKRTLKDCTSSSENRLGDSSWGKGEGHSFSWLQWSLPLGSADLYTEYFSWLLEGQATRSQKTSPNPQRNFLLADCHYFLSPQSSLELQWWSRSQLHQALHQHRGSAVLAWRIAKGRLRQEERSRQPPERRGKSTCVATSLASSILSTALAAFVRLLEISEQSQGIWEGRTLKIPKGRFSKAWRPAREKAKRSLGSLRRRKMFHGWSLLRVLEPPVVLDIPQFDITYILSIVIADGIAAHLAEHCTCHGLKLDHEMLPWLQE